MSRRAGLGTLPTRTREEAREAARRVGVEEPAPTPAAIEPPAAPEARQESPGATNEPAAMQRPVVSRGDVDQDARSGGYEDQDADDNPSEADDVDDAEAERPTKSADSRPRGSQRGRSRSAAKPASLIPSRVQQHRIQIGPRLRPAIHAEFSEYIHDLANTGLTQSDVVESALVEFMEKYPADVLRGMLLEAR